MLEHSIYSVISPEGCSSILWRSSEFIQQAAESLKLTSKDCLHLKIIDEIIEEIPGGAHRHKEAQIKLVKKRIQQNLQILKEKSLEILVKDRNEKFLNITSNNY